MKSVMRFGKNGKLSLRFISPFKILKGLGEVAYKLALPPGLLGVHLVFYVSMLKRYHGDGFYIIRWDSVLLDENLSYEEEPIAILDRDVHKLRSNEIAPVKVQWKNQPVVEANWETDAEGTMDLVDVLIVSLSQEGAKSKSLALFKDLVLSPSSNCC
ncbi:uncharacterized protein LOC132639348 [Lycium barbarum]|uniref:uncharacterized protein LOC132639348 n=1 Tax=Lycium barbarum TaxID=112863 RepID=UPI00293F2E97|nr:uncharacterized protein LOC132639348 [Lycium barbarum]